MHPVHLYTPCTSVCSLYTMCSPYVMGTWGHLYTLYVLGSWGHQYIFQTFQCLSGHPFASQFIMVMLGTLHHWGLLLYWTGCLWMSTMLHAVVPFFVVFIMSQASYYHCYDYDSSSDCCVFWYVVPSLNGYQGPLLDEASSNIGQHDVFLLPPVTPRHSGDVGLATVPQQQPPSQMPLQAYANYAMGPQQVGFSFRAQNDRKLD